MRLTLLSAAVACFATACVAQNWEIGGGIGYGWSLGSGVAGASTGTHVGHEARGAFTVITDENPYNYVGGEFQYLFRAGGTQFRSNGITETAPGYSNVIVYSLMAHLTPRESNFRPFLGAGAGIKVYTNSEPVIPQPLSSIALLAQGTQVEPVLSFAGGAKYLLPHHVQLRMDLRVFTSPTPDRLIRPIYPLRTKSWIFDFVPMVSAAYVF